MPQSFVLKSLFAVAGSLICLHAHADEKILGKLGQALDTVTIHSSTSSQSRAFYRAQAYEYLVINQGPNEKWVKVLMQNGRTGYALSEKIAKLPYDVTRERTQAPVSTEPSRLPSNYSRTSRGAAAQYGLRFVGTPYKWGGNDITRGIDCSAFVKKLYGDFGMKLPRTAAEQALVGQPIYRLENLVPGDRLYFWEKRRNKIGHTGLYLGGGYFVHSSSGKGGVSTDYLTDKWRRILVAARR